MAAKDPLMVSALTETILRGHRGGAKGADRGQEPRETAGAPRGRAERKWIGDPALMAVPVRSPGRPPRFLFPLAAGQKRGTGLKPEPDFEALPRRVVTLFSTAKEGPAYARRVDYSVKDFARGADKNDPLWIKGEPFFTARTENVPASVVKRVCLGDPCMHRLMVNPYDGDRIMSRTFVRALMLEVERQTGVNLLWIAAVHGKATTAHAENRHCHVIIRSKTYGPEVVLFVQPFEMYGFRQIAAGLAATILGVMTAEERARADALSAEIERNRALQNLKDAGAPEWVVKLMAGDG